MASGGHGDADRNRLALAKLVLEDAQGLIERSDEEIGDGVADSLLLRGEVCRCDERCCTSDVGRDDERAAFFIHFSGIEEAAAKA